LALTARRFTYRRALTICDVTITIRRSPLTDNIRTKIFRRHTLSFMTDESFGLAVTGYYTDRWHQTLPRLFITYTMRFGAVSQITIAILGLSLAGHLFTPISLNMSLIIRASADRHSEE
jgi:hypothetical protein